MPEENFALHYRTDFTFKKHMLVVEINEKGHVNIDPDYKKNTKRTNKNLITTILELILIKKISGIMKNLVE